ncbi:MAG TPA: exodeoxyribonuclease VII large subunit [Bacteroidales bacterium]|nr:exodeoxyribonuclease VII large subunit [Bacteroidales bacterium]
MNDKLTLSELQLVIKDSLYIALPELYWVIAEISEITENYAGHCYLELIEKNPDEKNVKARIKAIIWGNRYRFIKSFFENITGESLREGLKILVKTKVEYHEIYGLSLVISDIDPAFTIGDMAIKRQVVIKRLEQDGVFSMNKDLEFPAIPQKIAIISSKNAAGFSDFINQLTGNNFGYTFYTALFESAMQGEDTEQSVINALDMIATNSHLFDVVVIIRGGGSQSDLSWFDSYNIAYTVTQFPLPVISGIGHDKDMSVTDMVANKSLKTPTAVADYLIDCVAYAENSIIEMSSQIKDISRIIVEKNRSKIDTYKVKLIPVVRITISDIKNRLSGKIIKIANSGKNYIVRAGLVPTTQESKLVSIVKSYSSNKIIEMERRRQSLVTCTLNSLSRNSTRLEGLKNTLNFLNPENILKRGFTITSLNGMILRISDQLNTDDLIDTQFSDGSVRSRIIEKRGRKEEREKGRKED